ncbi:unnamed protein product [Psylliodes chrysocephalus]|uniref:Uncharacterized protein n=1 Tax=Psylliodes chrysocephalus TaxID=3402493 RepID=A0A9P0D1J0_9CUCU|nr:unnamed protein product [Psylliodes chrysocephala]
MDNAPYHSTLLERIPNASWNKVSLINRLKERNIKVPMPSMKLELLEIAKKHGPDKVYRLDRLALLHGDGVLRLPPYHCQFNPIELVWSECKRYYDAKITSAEHITADTVISVWNESLQQITPEK